MAPVMTIQEASENFEKAAANHFHFTEIGKHQKANNSYDEIMKNISFLKENKAIYLLEKYLNNTNLGVQLWAACYLLPINEEKSLSILEQLSKAGGFNGFSAKMTIEEWKKGNLTF